MDEKELDKKLNSDVKPGEELFKINEAQNAANNLLTEQRSNLEAEKQIATANSARDTELRGALELGAMSQNAASQQQVTLPPQAAGLRPETQQLLAKYGINPTITESSRSNSSTNRTRSSTSNSQNVPNNQGGETRVTNTTNVTNITNNNTKTETNVDMPAAPPTPAAVAPIPVRQPADNTNQFKTYMNNIFRKRDAEKQLQEREFRKRDWSLQRMTRKVMARMESISGDFARKMNPENIGRTFWSQMKVFLFAAGLAILPKVFPKLISGIDSLVTGVTDAFNFLKSTFDGSKGTFTQKLGQTFSAILHEANLKLGKLIAGKDYKEGQDIGIVEALGNKLSALIGGRDEKGNIIPLGDQISRLADVFKDSLHDYMTNLAKERSDAVRSVLDKAEWTNNLGLPSLTKALKNIGNVIGAAVGGYGFVEYAETESMKSEANEKLSDGIDEDDYSRGKIRTQKGASQVLSNMSDLAKSKSEPNSAALLGGLNQLNTFGIDNGLELKWDEVIDILSSMSSSEEEKARILSKIHEAISSGKLKEEDVRGRRGIIGRKLIIPKEYVSAFIGLLSGLDTSFNDSQANNYIKVRNLFRNNDAYLDKVAQLDELRRAQINGSINADQVYRFTKDAGVSGTLSMIPGVSTIYSAGRARGWWGSDNDYEFYTAAEDKGDTKSVDAAREKKKEYQQERQDIEYRFKTNPVVTGSKRAAESELDEYKRSATEAADKVGEVAVEAYNTGKDLVMTGLYGEKYNSDENSSSDTSYTPDAPKSPNIVNAPNLDIDEFNPSINPVNIPINAPDQVPIPEIDTNVTDPTIIPVAIPKGDRKENVGGLTQYIARPDLVDEDGTIKNDTDRFLYPGLRNTQAVMDRRARYIMDWLTDRGFSTEQAAGITGVIYAESKYDPGAINKAELKKLGYGPTGKGICQWSNTRDDEFVEWYKNKYGEEKFPEKTSLTDQLEFMLYDMNKRKAFMRAISSAKTVDEAADYMLRGYENGGINAMASKKQLDEVYSDAVTSSNYQALVVPRIQFSRDVYEKYTGNKLPDSIDPSVLEESGTYDYSYSGNSEPANIGKSNSLAENFASSWEGAINSLDEMLGAEPDATRVNTRNFPNEVIKYTKGGNQEDTTGIDSVQIAAENAVQTFTPNLTGMVDSILNNQPAEEPEIDTTETADTVQQQPQMISTVGPQTTVSNSGNTSITNYIISDPKNSFIDMRSRDHRRN